MSSLGLPKGPNGLTTALNGKLDDALAALAANDTATACGSLNMCVDLVEARRTRRSSAKPADGLTADANEIRNRLGC